MLKLLVGLLTVFLLQTSADAADKVRISIANLSGQFMTFALAHKEVSSKKKESKPRSSESPAERALRR